MDLGLVVCQHLFDTWSRDMPVVNKIDTEVVLRKGHQIRSYYRKLRVPIIGAHLDRHI